MDNLDFLVEILTSDFDYWVVARRDYINEYGRSRRTKDQILFICIPHKIQRGLKRDDIKLSDVEELYRAEVQNVFISPDYPPFQFGISMREIYRGYPVKGEIAKNVLSIALSMQSQKISEYKTAIDEFLKIVELGSAQSPEHQKENQ